MGQTYTWFCWLLTGVNAAGVDRAAGRSCPLEQLNSVKHGLRHIYRRLPSFTRPKSDIQCSIDQALIFKLKEDVQ
jgi:hypothetical protein